MKKLLVSIGIILLCILNTYSQNDIRSFIDPLVKNSQKEVSFYILGIDNKDQRNEIQESLKNAENIYYAMIYPDNKCHLKMNSDYDANYIYKILYSHNLDFDYSNILKKPNPNFSASDTKNNSKSIPSDFPMREYTGNDKYDEEVLARKVKEWKKQHPEEWKQMLENRYK